MEFAVVVVISLFALSIPVVDGQNAVYGCGSNEQGALGFGPIDAYGAADQHYLTSPDWTAAGGVPSGLQKVSAGYLFSLALDGSGKIYSWGLNSNGQLGLGDTTTRDYVSAVVWTPANPYPASGIATIYAGDSISLAVAGDGTLYMWGWLTYAQPALVVLNPIPVAWTNAAQPSGGVKQVSAGVGHITLVGADKHAYAWGTNTDGQLCDWSNTNRNAPVAVVWVPTTASEPSSGILQTAAGGSHTVILGGDHAVYTCGLNTQGQLGVGSFTSYNQPIAVHWGVSGWPAFPGAVTQVAAGLTHTIVLGVDGQAYAWGSDTYNEQGDGAQGVLFGYIYPQQVIWGGGAFFPAGGLTAVLAGNHGSAVLSAGGALFTWGYNLHGTSCDGTTASYPYPHPAPWGGVISLLGSISPSSIHLTLISSPNIVPLPTPTASFVPGNQKMMCWGYNQHGSADSTTQGSLEPFEAGFPGGFPSAGVLALASGSTAMSFAAITGDRQVLTWGNNQYGNLGIGANPTETAAPTPVQWTGVPAPSGGVLSVSMSNYVTLAVGADNQVYGWGYNAYAMLCTTTNGYAYNPVLVPSNGRITAASAGFRATYFVDSDGLGYACGQNDQGQQGDGVHDLSHFNAPMMALASNAYATPIVQIAGGQTHGILLAGGVPYTWGNGPQAGNSTYVFAPTRTRFGGASCAAMPASGFVAIAAGAAFNLALSGDGAVYGWGSNSYGQVGTGLYASNFYCPIKVGWTTPSVPKIVSIQAGTYFSMAVADNGEVYGWGYSGVDFLGSNHGAGATSFGIPFPVLGVTTKVATLAVGEFTTCAIVTDDDIEYSPSPTPDVNIDELMCFGQHVLGDLPDGRQSGSYITNPVDAAWDLLGGAPRVGLRKMISSGSSYILGLLDDLGTFYTWGYGIYGQLGTGQQFAAKPEAVQWNGAPAPAGGLVEVALGTYTVIALGAGGELYGWGYNTANQLCATETNSVGLPTVIILFPERILSDHTITQIGAGGSVNYFIDDGGNAYSCGSNFQGSQDIGSSLHNLIGMQRMIVPNGAPVTAISGGLYASLMMAGGVVYEFGAGAAAGQQSGAQWVATPATFGAPGCAQLPAAGIQAISAGYQHAMVLDFAGLVYTWGANNGQQLGQNITTPLTTCPGAVVWHGAAPVVVQIHAGYLASSALTNGGLLYTWGLLAITQISVPALVSSALPGITSVAHGLETICYFAPGIRHPPTHLATMSRSPTPSKTPFPSQVPFPAPNDLCGRFQLNLLSPNFLNGDFELGNLRGWNVTTQRDPFLGAYFPTSGKSSPISFEKIARAPEGQWYAVSDQRTSGSYVMHQDFYIPAGYSGLFITFYMTCNSRWPASVQSTMSWMPPPATNQQCRVDIVDPSFDDWFGANANAGVIQNLVAPFATADEKGADPFTQYVIPIDGLAHDKWYRLAFRSVNDVYFLNNGIDGVTLCFAVYGSGSGGDFSESASESHSASGTRSPSLSSTPTLSMSSTNTASATAGSSPSFSSSSTSSISVTSSVTITPSASVSPSPSRTPSRSASESSSVTRSVSTTTTASLTPSTTTTASKSPSTTPTVSLSATESSSRSPTISLTASLSLSRTRSKSTSISNTPTESPSVSTTSTRTATRSRSFSRSISESLSQGTSASGTATESRSVSKTPTVTRTSSETESPSSVVSASPSRKVSASSSISKSPSLSGSNTASISETGSNTPTKSETGSITRSTFPTKSVSESFVAQPSAPTQPSPSRNPSQSAAASRTTSVSKSFTSSRSFTSTETASVSISESGSNTRTSTRSRSFTASVSSTETATPSLTHGASKSSTETASASLSTTSSISVSKSFTRSTSVTPSFSVSRTVSPTPTSFGYIIITVDKNTLFAGQTATVTARLPGGKVALEDITLTFSYAGTATHSEYSVSPHNYLTIAQGGTTGTITITASNPLTVNHQISLYALSVSDGLINSTNQYFPIALVGLFTPSPTPSISTSGSSSETSSETPSTSLTATRSQQLSRTSSITPSPTKGASHTPGASRTPSNSPSNTKVLSTTRSITSTNSATNTPTPGTLITITLSSQSFSPGGSVTLTATLVTALITTPVTAVLSWGGTAVLNTDYSRTSANLVIPAGQTTGSITITDLETATPASNAPTLSIYVTNVMHGALQSGTPSNYHVNFA